MRWLAPFGKLYSSVIHFAVSYGEVVRGIMRSFQALVCQVLAGVRCTTGLVEKCMIATGMMQETSMNIADYEWDVVLALERRNTLVMNGMEASMNRTKVLEDFPYPRDRLLNGTTLL